VDGILWDGSKEQKENVAFVLWTRTNPNSWCEAGAWVRRDVEKGVVVKRRISGREVVDEFDKDDDEGES
jgi:hypothetical protein